MRIRITGVVTLAALSLVLTGCGKSDGDKAGSASTTKAAAGGTLTIWADDQRSAALKPFAEKFGKDNGVTVEVQAVSKDLQTNFVTASQSGKGPDIVVGAHDWIGNLVQNGAIDPVQLPDAQKSAFAEVAVKAVTFNGQLYGVPYAIENLALIRNTDLAPTAPASIEDLVKAGQTLKTAGKVTNIMSLQVGANGDYDPADLGVDKPASVEAFKKIAALGEKGSGALTRSITGDNAIPTFTGGKTAFLISGPWAVADIKKAGVKYDITPIPAFAGGKPAQPFVGVQAFYVASKGRSKALANEFITNYLTKPELQVALYQANPRPPALVAALEQVKGTDPDIQKWLDAGKGGAVLPAIPAMAAVWDPFGKAEAAIVGGADVQTTLAAAGKAITEAINK